MRILCALSRDDGNFAMVKKLVLTWEKSLSLLLV